MPLFPASDEPPNLGVNAAAGASVPQEDDADPHAEPQAWLAAIMNSTDDAVIGKNLDGIIVSWNIGAVRLFGYTVEEAVGQPMTMLIPPEQRNEKPTISERLQRGERIEHHETVRRRKDGTLVEVSLTIAPIRNAAGHAIGASTIVRDVSDRKRGAEVDRRLAAIVESSDDAIVSKNLDGVIQSWNAGAERVFGYTAAEAIGRPVLMLIPEGRHDEEPVILDRLRRGERIEHYETVRRCKDGRLIDVSLTVSPIIDASGRVVGASKIARDVTAQRRVQRELAEAHAKALAANRAKDDFLAALSHELRTPLNPVLLVASASADDPKLPPAVRSDFDLIRKNIELEARLIDDLLDLARITRGKLPLNPSTNDLHAIVRDAIETIRADAEAKKLALACNFSVAPLTVTGDAVRLQQVLWNVLKNAVKFTPEGGRIGISTRSNPARGCAVVEISDTGVGLAKEELERIFEAFVQGGAAAGEAHRFGGLGLGLTISKRITELHRGSIRAVSEGRGRGATFIIELPIAELPKGPAKDPARNPEAVAGAGAPKRKILLVEDHEPSRKTLAHLLRRRGFEVSAVGTMAEARSVAANETLDVALCDIGLPDGDGVELIAELSRRHGLKSVALTGFGMEQDIQRCQEAGAFAHLTKPVSIRALEEALATGLETTK